MSWISLIVKDLALGVGPHVMWWLLEGIEPSFDACLSPGGRFTRAAEERNGRKNDLLEPPAYMVLVVGEIESFACFWTTYRVLYSKRPNQGAQVAHVYMHVGPGWAKITFS